MDKDVGGARAPNNAKSDVTEGSVLSQLADRCENSSRFDRAVDWEIHLRNGLWGVGAYGNHPRYQSSLEEAEKLVPPGMIWTRDVHGDFQVWRDAPLVENIEQISEGKTLVAAALRSLAAQPGDTVSADGDKQRIDGIRKLAGYVEDGSDTTVQIFQDDATRSWLIKAGKDSWHGSSLRDAIDAALNKSNPAASGGAE